MPLDVLEAIKDGIVCYGLRKASKNEQKKLYFYLVITILIG